MFAFTESFVISGNRVGKSFCERAVPDQGFTHFDNLTVPDHNPASPDRFDDMLVLFQCHVVFLLRRISGPMFKDYCIVLNRTNRPDSKHIRNQRSPCYMDSASRFREIDAARGIAILMMIVFHTVFDLNFFMIAAGQCCDRFLALVRDGDCLALPPRCRYLPCGQPCPVGCTTLRFCASTKISPAAGPVSSRSGCWSRSPRGCTCTRDSSSSASCTSSVSR